MRWRSQPPRAPLDERFVSRWVADLVAWLDKQEQDVKVVDSIVERVIDNVTLVTGTNITCAHSLNLQTPSAASPNCIWLICGWRHSGLGTGAQALSVGYVDGTVTKNSIQLRFYAPGFTINVSNPLTVLLAFFAEPIPRIPQ